MSNATIQTWRDLLFPDNQDIRISLMQFDDTEGGQVQTSTFAPQAGNPEHFPSYAYLFRDFSSRIRHHLGVIINEHYSDRVAGTSFINHRGRNVTPAGVLGRLQDLCDRCLFRCHYEQGSVTIARHLSDVVSDIFKALTESEPRFDTEIHSSWHEVISDFGYLLGNRIKILGENKSPNVFNNTIGAFIQQLGNGNESPVAIFSSTLTPYHGYQAIFGKLGFHASDVQPRVRWLVVFSGLNYVIAYIPRTGRPRLFCSPIMQFCLPPADGQNPATQVRPPIWSVLVYMLLVETLDIDDKTVEDGLGLVVPAEPAGPAEPAVPVEGPSSSNLGWIINEHGNRRSARLALRETTECEYHSGALTEAPESMTVRCIDGRPMELILVDTPISRHSKKQYHPFIYFDSHLGAGWASVFASSKSHLVVKFAAVPKKNKSELLRQLSNEKAVYNKLRLVTGWIVPSLIGEYKWYGGRSLILSSEGRPLSYLEKFSMLSLMERLILFVEVYAIHCLGVEHGDLTPRNVLRAKRSCLFKIIDFGFSNVDHTCPGWSKCGELKQVWRELELDMNFRFRFNVGYLLLVFVMVVFAFVTTSGIPANSNWRMWPQKHLYL